ncbi:MAG: TrkA C-terminal domain-containing protein, partial [Planctomycetota bacterium]
ALIWLANSEWVERRLNRIISRALRNYTSLNVQDYVALLHLAQGYVISELRVDPEDWLANKTLIQLALPQEGVLVLGVQRKGGKYVGAPQGGTLIRPYDTLLLYADQGRIEELDTRRAGSAGDEEHAAAVQQQGRMEAKEEVEERTAA